MPKPNIDRLTGRYDDLEWHRWTAELGNKLAIAAALAMQARLGREAPPWLVRASAAIQHQMLSDQWSNARGRSSDPIARRLRDNCDYLRYDMVCEVREKRVALRTELEHLRRRDSVQSRKIAKGIELTLECLGRSDLDAFEWVSNKLKGHRAQGSATAVRRSYYKIQKALESDEDRARYHALDHHFERAIGTHVDSIG